MITMYQRIKRRTFEIIESANKGDIASKIFDVFILILIMVNIILVIADTFNLPKEYTIISKYIEIISVIIFTIEYVLRVWTSDLYYPDKSKFKARVRYIFSFMAIIDLLAILPFYIPFIIPLDLRVLRMLRIVRLLRVFKINRYTTALQSIANVFKSRASQLCSSMLVLFILMLIASILMYNIEHNAQPEQFENAFSALWWAMATLTTVGYGDIYPVTALGKLIGSIISILGIALVAVPTGIISAGFVEQLDKKKKDRDNNK